MTEEETRHWNQILRRGTAQPGVKKDTGKTQFRLILPKFYFWMAHILTYGATKYPEPDNWKKVEPYRYEDALERHWNEWRQGEWLDKETGAPHLAHVAVNAMFLWWFGDKQQTQQQIESLEKQLDAPKF